MDFLRGALITSNSIQLWELYLLRRQWQAHCTSVIPQAFEGRINQEAFDKVQAYSRDKIQYSMVHAVASMVESSASLLCLPWLWYGVEKAVRATLLPDIKRGGFAHSLAVQIVSDVISTVTQLPFSIYRTFVLEAKHGFNKTTKKEFVKDQVKSFLLRVGLLYPVTIGLVNVVVNTFGRKFPVYLFGGATALITVATFLLPAVIQPLFNKFTPLSPDSTLRAKVEALASKLQFPLKKIFEVDGSRRSEHSNAYFYGFFNSKRIVLFDTLLKQLTEPQILAVLCHEFGHWYHNHVTKMFGIGLVHLLFFCLGAQHALFNEKLYLDFGLDRGDMSPFMGMMLFSVVFFEPLSTLQGYLISALSRRFEFQADAFAVSQGFGEELREALRTMQAENKASITPDPLFAALHYSHPPMVERLQRLDSLIRKMQ